MRKFLFVLAISSIVFASLVLLFDPPAPAEAAAPCREGYSIGGWNLPGATGVGSVEGKLVYQGQSVLALQARLIGTRNEGRMHGRLIRPDGSLFAIVEGKYEGSNAGQGRFRAEISPPPFGADSFEGKIGGEYEDPAALPDPVGKYKAEWVICSTL